MREEMTEREENRPLNHWLKMNRKICRLRWLNFLQTFANIVLSVFCLSLYQRPPIVAFAGNWDTHFFPAQKREAPTQRGTIKRQIGRFIKGRYVWEEFSLKGITKSIGPFVTQGFARKLTHELKSIGKEVKGKKLSQTVAGVKIFVTKEKTLAVFDRILRIDGIPLIIPTELSFQLVKGERNQHNPSGVEINGIIIHEKK